MSDATIDVTRWTRMLPLTSLEPDSASSALLARIDRLAIPFGALGRLHDIARQLANIGVRSAEELRRASILVFAGDHGVAHRGVSAFPRSVTRINCEQMLRGRAVVAVLAKQVNADLVVVDVGIDGPGVRVPADTHLAGSLYFRRVRSGTRDLVSECALDLADVEKAIDVGFNCVMQLGSKSGLVVVGEMGIGNTTSASALTSSLLNVSPTLTVGPGSGLDAEGMKRKAALIERAIGRARAAGMSFESPISLLQHLGGLEICAMVGAFMAAASIRRPVLVDGFIAMVAAYLALRVDARNADAQIWASRATEPGATLLQEAAGKVGLLDLGMRLGEGTAALLAIPIVRAAAAQLDEIGVMDELEIAP